MRVSTVSRAALLAGLVAGLCGGALVLETARPPAFAEGGRRICQAGRAAGGAAYGTVHFASSCTAAARAPLDRAVARLDSFEAEPADFMAIAARDPGCAIAWWGVAMAARGNPLGGMLDDKEIAEGRGYVAHAQAARPATARERALIEATAVYYGSFPDNTARARAYAEKMDALHAAYPDDADIAAFDGLAIIEGVDLDDATYARQKRAGAILEAVMRAHPENPGAPHYLIHAYDYPALAPLAVPAAEVYPTLAPASSHAQHMPSHIWSMLGEWDKSIAANRQSEFVAEPTSAHDAIVGDIVFAHAFDFIAYARLQKAEDEHVARDLARLMARQDAPPVVAARYALERGAWTEAARLAVPDDPFNAVLVRFARAYGAARAGNVSTATTELRALRDLRQPVGAVAGAYWAQSVDIYADAVEAWILQARRDSRAALALMSGVAIADDSHGKHIYLENKLLPMREALADMELAQGDAKAALADYEASLALAPNRYRSFLGAAKAAELSGDPIAARGWWTKLVALTKDGDGTRPGIAEGRAFLAAHG